MLLFLIKQDNGGCPTAGGRNTPLRGTKGSLFEGGVHVEAFIYSPHLSPCVYNHVFHVTDWFPTLLDIADSGYVYKPDPGYRLDGVSHYLALVDHADPPREYMLVNYYYDPLEADKNLWTGENGQGRRIPPLMNSLIHSH